MFVVGRLIRCWGLGVSALGPALSHPQAWVSCGLESTPHRVDTSPRQRTLTDGHKRSLTSNHGCCNHMIFAKLPNMFI